ncbi:5'-methylthioadenosine/S-adenosylhomocysteine nucleosidase [Chelatococcus sp. SYSU_G07232]|uniref:5'-methylthioadenosine/S-adenosylhomocysteine nucleosidase n=1 Tax=Chelatococcus albus TaxID=3047466 RepID=A0ABT7ALD1_9HYPH|nr:5'-methylthioadenosine/S-adenosylhomocysteine nucleosidase [Chelatococcus sp. SYSU_G07232]MDJ1160188.1 5'-methylthioadenosine/S-adenosylhomocysteine nucleosidase [Chelatococcus sp. SYSU_G07232]
MTEPSRHVALIEGVEVLFVMATEQEYGAHLRRRIDPLITGVGPVEAAVATTAALAALDAAGRLPDLVLCLGSAGSRRLEHAAVYQASSVSYRDMDASLLGFPRGCTPFLDEPAAVPIAHRIPGVPAASLSTGGDIVSGAAYDAIDADMVDMETYAVLRAARCFDLPLIGLRGISDGRDDLTGLHDWTEYLHVVDERLAGALDLFAQALASGALSFRRRAGGAGA